MLGRLSGIVLLATIAAALVFTWLVANERVSIPERWNPFTPLDVQAPPGPLTSWKLWRVTRDPAACKLALKTADLTYTNVPDSNAAGNCALTNAVRVQRFADMRVSSSFVASCPLALGLAMFERHALQPTAQSIYGERVRELDHVGSYACRNVNHSSDGALSQHASANAIDIEAFVLTDGTRISIARDWSADSRAGRFLEQTRDGACGLFHAVLGPDYNALHRAHFHLDMGPYNVCR
ncbi:extensin family protein [Paraburkholderia sp.]|uniref:extensin-like domain-containing protein n=1 Tax=Paraburkholderia sp. TaxID=1926495 RepID=UPI0023840FA9|nr:extensin family protein [Paraburkholderia sp.]MDE1180356.1 extensin family protein [Paraburkholderia sp.]